MLLEWLLPPCLGFVGKYCKPFIKCHPMHLTVSTLTLYLCMMPEIK
jgi:hypothetical protein